VVLDQLNTHMSLPMVLAMAKVCGLSAPGEEMLGHHKARRAWLELPGKAVVFHFTPKHASWLNPVEIWFGVLVRKVLRRGSFCSKVDLQQKVEAFVSYFNEKLAHPYHLRRYQWAA
jgi:putative transposase